MKIERLHSYRDLFKKESLGHPDYTGVYKWECQEIFAQEWDIDALDFGAMFGRALSHPTSGNLWGGNHQSAKSVMLEFIQLDREFVRSMFRDLFSQQRDLVMRIERFHFHCDQLLEQLQRSKPKVNHHHHQGYYMPLLYLTLRYPREITLYEPDLFKKSLEQLGAKNPNDATLSRFIKVVPILQSQLEQDPELMELLQQKINSKNPETSRSLWLAYEFYRFIAGQKS